MNICRTTSVLKGFQRLGRVGELEYDTDKDCEQETVAAILNFKHQREEVRDETPRLAALVHEKGSIGLRRG
jgi:hypothetical protein